MKKSYFQRGNGLRTRTVFMSPQGLGALVVSIVFLILLALVRFVFPDTLALFTTPLWKAGNGATESVTSLGTFFTDKTQLAKERDQYRSENDRLAHENQVLSARAEDLTVLLGTRPKVYGTILGGVIARPPVSPYDVLVVDVGTDSGVRVGALVEGAGGVPVGRVATSAKRSSRVLLFSAPGQETAAWLGEKRLPLTLTGQGSGALMALVPREAAITVGDVVYTTGPGALPTGTVVRVDTDPASPKARIIIRPSINPFQVAWVTIAHDEAL